MRKLIVSSLVSLDDQAERRNGVVVLSYASA